jgi:hypothetical protein
MLARLRVCRDAQFHAKLAGSKLRNAMRPTKYIVPTEAPRFGSVREIRTRDLFSSVDRHECALHVDAEHQGVPKTSTSDLERMVRGLQPQPQRFQYLRSRDCVVVAYDPMSATASARPLPGGSAKRGAGGFGASPLRRKTAHAYFSLTICSESLANQTSPFVARSSATSITSASPVSNS